MCIHKIIGLYFKKSILYTVIHSNTVIQFGIMIADSLEELEDAIKRFDEDMNEDEFDLFTDQTHVI